MIWAGLYGRSEMLKLLISAGGNVNHVDRLKNSALIFAARDGHTEAVRVLIVAGAELNH